MKNTRTYILISILIISIFGVVSLNYFLESNKNSDVDNLNVDTSKTNISTGKVAKSNNSGTIIPKVDTLSINEDSIFSDPKKSLDLAKDYYEKNKTEKLSSYIQLINIYESLGDYDNVIKYGEEGVLFLDKKSKEDNKSMIFLNNEFLSTLIKAYLRKGKNIEAENLINKFKDVDLSYEKGLLKYKNKKYDEAISIFEKTNTGYNDSNIMIAKSYENKLDYNKSINYYKKQYDLAFLMNDDDKMRKYSYMFLISEKLGQLYLKVSDKKNSDYYININNKLKLDIDGIGKGGLGLDKEVLLGFVKEIKDF